MKTRDINRKKWSETNLIHQEETFHLSLVVSLPLIANKGKEDGG